MNSAQKTKYSKCKYLVKKWESDFKKSNGCNPTKLDIKQAPNRIKDAYKTYWELKTLALESSILNATFDENAIDCFNSSISKSDDKDLSYTSQEYKDSDESRFCLPLLDDTIDTSCHPVTSSGNLSTIINNEAAKEAIFVLYEKDENKDIQPSTSNEPVSALKPISENVWGNHLSKKPLVQNKKTLQKSVSFQYTEKLFAKSKFSKRNPRKPCNFKKNKSFDSSLSESFDDDGKECSLNSSVLDDGLNRQDLKEDVASQSSTHFDLFSEKGKVVIKSAPKVTYQGVSAIQSLLNLKDSGPMKKRELDKGWLARTEAVDSGADLSKGSDSCTGTSLVGQSGDSISNSRIVTPALGTEGSCFDSSSEKHEDSGNDDNDIIYDSDSESKSLSSHISLVGNKQICNKTGITPSEVSCSVKPLMSVGKKDYQTLSVSAIKPGCIKLSPEQSSDELRQSKLSNTPVITSAKRPPDSFLSMLNPPKRCKTDPKTAFRPEPIFSAAQSAAAVVNKASNENKVTILQRKVSSGKANENFVKVNIQKKVFVKGKKNFKYSTYKKKKWKTMQASGNEHGLESGVLKCFKCGNVGHFSRNCKAVGNLLPYEEEVDEESLFPTLAEAEEAAKEAAKVSIVKRSLPSTSRKRSLRSKPVVNSVADNVDAEEIDTGCYENSEIDFPALPESEDEKPAIEPIYQLNPDGSLPDPPDEVYEELSSFGYTGFREGQKEAIMRILCGQSTLVSLATGCGKSLCYQLPAYFYHVKRNAITLVISPLVSLMEDQVSCCGDKLKMACLHRNQTEKQRDAVKEKLKNKELHVILVAPESLTPDGANALFSILPPVAFVCIDEAHCLSHWSHNFRPSYLTVCQVVRQRLGVRVMLGLTATVSIPTVGRVLETLGCKDNSSLVSSRSQLPDNLLLTVSRDIDRNAALIQLLNGERFSQCQSVIVYCTRQEVCNSVASYLRINLKENESCNTSKKSRISSLAEVYHAGLTPAKRKQVQNAFMTGKIRFVVATVAFGMGINKNDIRGIIHYNMPSSFENYVQEVGRAGRDGQISHCHLFLDRNGGDLCELRRHIYANGIERSTLRKFLNSVLGGSDSGSRNAICKQVDSSCCGHERALPVDSIVESLDLPLENLATLLSYLELSQELGFKLLSPAYTICRIVSYKGPRYLATVAKTCPPLAVGIVQAKASGQKIGANVEFDVIKVAATINWDSGIVKRHLKNLEWTKSEAGVWSKSGIMVEFSQLGLRLVSPCNLTSDECDLTLDSLHRCAIDHETNALRQLQFLFDSLLRVSHENVADCCDSVDPVRCDKLFDSIKRYFTDEHVLDSVKVEEGIIEDELTVAADMRNLISLYKDCNFTGRAIARILHGISSPNYPAPVWGRTKFWRLHLNKDFHALAKLATKQIIIMK